ncbi:MAG: hypothetical protein M5U26_05650 [Planctomycetota bacterium]|nr:hypothetical protein [Planctomycetota bacterium]
MQTSARTAAWPAMLLGAILVLMLHAVPARAADDGPIDMNRAKSLYQKKQKGEALTADEQAYLDRALQERNKRQGGERPGGNPGANPNGRAPRSVGKPTTGMVPLTELGTGSYKGQDGGLYGGGLNEPPAALQAAATVALKQIQPLNTEGRPADDGRIVLISISMSNATHEFSTFKPLADRDPEKSGKLAIVDCAQSGMAMAEWSRPDANTWREAERRLKEAGVTPAQVQVAWIKLANKHPGGELDAHGKKLQADAERVVNNAKQLFPNLRIGYLSSRIYGGYADGNLNPEPFAYEGAFAVRWLIQDQVRGKSELNYDPARGEVRAPVLLWGPYLWADGTTPRKGDGLVWNREDLADDGVHPSGSGREKVAQMLLKYFKTDPNAKSWFLK